MVDSTASFERDAELPSYSPVNGGRPGGQRGSHATNQPSDGLEGAGPEHASALLAMGAAKQAAGDYSEAEELFRKALEIGERFLGTDNAALIPALTSLASARVMCGKLAEAQQLAKRAVTVSENGLVENEPEVAILINDLARLCLKQSAHGVAEPLLLRLLEMKRSKGEDHPEVGTVLASLAAVRHALGRHESAEQLWRRVLEIRERTLAPNHFGLATALEHLAETCAARGKIGEALQLFQRAQNIRELTLGAGHPSLRISRDRIADLQLQAGESLDTAHDAPSPAPDKLRLLAANSGVASQRLVPAPPPPARERPDAPRKGSAWVVEREPVIEAIAPPPPPPAPSVADVAPAAAEAGPAAAEPVSYRDVILSIQQEMEEEEEEEEEEADATTAWAPGFFASVGVAVKERQQAALIGVGVLALLDRRASRGRCERGSRSRKWFVGGPGRSCRGRHSRDGVTDSPRRSETGGEKADRDENRAAPNKHSEGLIGVGSWLRFRRPCTQRVGGRRHRSVPRSAASAGCDIATHCL